MCGRYTLDDAPKLAAKFKAYTDHFEMVKPNYNVAPTQSMPVVVAKEGKNQLQLMHWGIARTLGKDVVKELINTRSEKAFDRFWNKTVLHQRCLVPASGFYEWKATKDGKHPFFIHPKDQDIFAFAGIYSEFINKGGQKIQGYSILTTDANQEMSTIHSRMPIILRDDEYEAWLHAPDDREAIEPLLHPYHDDGLELYEVSRAVNVPKNNSPDLLLPV